MEENEQISVYYNLAYTVQTIPNEDGIEEPFDYIVDFRFSVSLL